MIGPLLNAIAGFYRRELNRHSMLAQVLVALDAAELIPDFNPDPKPVMRHLPAALTNGGSP